MNLNFLNFATIDWPVVLLVAAIALVVLGFSWKLLSDRIPSAKAPSAAPERSGIGRYRPHH